MIGVMIGLVRWMYISLDVAKSILNIIMLSI